MDKDNEHTNWMTRNWVYTKLNWGKINKSFLVGSSVVISK